MKASFILSDDATQGMYYSLYSETAASPLNL